MRTIRRVIWHCSATPSQWADRQPNNAAMVAAIRAWHTLPKPKGNGWSDIGYHFVIFPDGGVVLGRPLGSAGAHVAGENHDSIGICYIGGMDDANHPADTRTPEQVLALDALTRGLVEAFGPGVTVHGHNEFANKACPSFDVRSDLARRWAEAA